MKTFVLLSIFLVLYHYLFYPALVIAWARLRPAPAHRRYAPGEKAWPSVTMVIAAYNEERVIAGKLANTLEIDYPGEFEVIVVSDGSNDRTPEIVAGFADRGVVSMHESARRGKTPALNRGVAAARGEILVFSDANNDFNRDAIKALVQHLADDSIGGVCGVKQIKEARDRESSTGDGLYWRYESAIKLAEGRIGSITNADGEIFAMRKSLWRPIPEQIINDDAQITFDIIEQGKRILYEPGARSAEYASIHIRDDFYVKVRMVAGGFQTIAQQWRKLFPPLSGFAFAFVSHKVLRYLVPLFLLVIFFGSLVLALGGERFFALLLVLQGAFYGVAWLGWQRIAAGPLPTAVYVPFYFSAMNLAALFGFWRFVTGKQGTAWRKAQR
jgi:cellulose synthase/poly-beta-1,6-N-acetylglucosamine synthase-like glycosyltransferase